MMKSRGYGLLPSPPSSDDVGAERLFGVATPSEVTPASYTGLLQFVTIADQGATNSCVWQAIVQAIHVFLKARNPESDIRASVLFGYYNTLLTQGTIADVGCIPREALSTLTSLGFCSEDQWPFSEGKVLQHPYPDTYTEATDQKLITHFYRLSETGEDLVARVKIAISKGYPVIYGSFIDQPYEDYSSGVIGPSQGPWTGSHMRCLVGYTPNYAVEANSWGTGWGNNGLGYVGWDLIKSSNAFDFWVFDSVPQPVV